VTVTQQQRQAAIDAARLAASQQQNASVEGIQAAATGASHGALLQSQSVEVTQLQTGIYGSTAGALCLGEVRRLVALGRVDRRERVEAVAEGFVLDTTPRLVLAVDLWGVLTHELGRRDHDDTGDQQDYQRDRLRPSHESALQCRRVGRPRRCDSPSVRL